MSSSNTREEITRRRDCLMKKVEDEVVGLGECPKRERKTDGKFYLDSPCGKVFDLDKVDDIEVIALAYARMKRLDRELLDAQCELGANPHEIGILRFKEVRLSEWRKDFRNRIAIINWSKKAEALRAIKSNLMSITDNLFSAEETELEWMVKRLNELEEMFGGLDF